MSIEELRRVIVQLLCDFHLGPPPPGDNGYGTVNLSAALASAIHPLLKDTSPSAHDCCWHEGSYDPDAPDWMCCRCLQRKPSEPSPAVVAEAVKTFVQHDATDVRQMTKRLDWLLKTGRIE